MNPKDIEDVISALQAGKTIDWRYPKEGSFESLSYNSATLRFVWIERAIHQETKVSQYTQREFHAYLLNAKHLDRSHFSEIL